MATKDKKDTLDVGGSPAAPYFGPGGREDATRRARLRREAKEKGVPGAATAGPAEASKEPALRGDREPAENVSKRDPASTKAEFFDTKSKSATETDQKEPTGDPEVRQPGTAPKAKSDVKGATTTSKVGKRPGSKHVRERR